MEKASVISFRIDPELQSLAQQAATASGKTLSDWVISLIAAQVSTRNSVLNDHRRDGEDRPQQRRHGA